MVGGVYIFYCLVLKSKHNGLNSYVAVIEIRYTYLYCIATHPNQKQAIMTGHFTLRLDIIAREGHFSKLVFCINKKRIMQPSSINCALSSTSNIF
jgi:hypothetical protein